MSPGELVERYEELRATVLGQGGSLRWGLNVLHRKGLGAWCHAQMASPDVSSRRPRWPDGGLPATPDTGLHTGRREIIPILAKMIASSFLNEVSP